MKFYVSVLICKDEKNFQFSVNAISYNHASKKAFEFCKKHVDVQESFTMNISISPNKLTLKDVKFHTITVGKRISGSYLCRTASKYGGGFDEEYAINCW